MAFDPSAHLPDPEESTEHEDHGPNPPLDLNKFKGHTLGPWRSKDILGNSGRHPPDARLMAAPQLLAVLRETRAVLKETALEFRGHVGEHWYRQVQARARVALALCTDASEAEEGGGE